MEDVIKIEVNGKFTEHFEEYLVELLKAELQDNNKDVIISSLFYEDCGLIGLDCFFSNTQKILPIVKNTISKINIKGISIKIL